MNHHTTTLGTIVGALIAFVDNFGPDLIHTAVLTIFGATISYFTTLIIKWLVTKYKDWKAK